MNECYEACTFEFSNLFMFVTNIDTFRNTFIVTIFKPTHIRFQTTWFHREGKTLQIKAMIYLFLLYFGNYSLPLNDKHK